MEITFRPILQWPGKFTPDRKGSRFKASYNQTLRLLDAELLHLKARNIVLQVALNEAQIRLDGRPRADSKPRHPGVILSFDSKHGPLSYPCDRFDSWEDNLRAIALSLEHLRAVDRYGVTKRGEQYHGWTALPPPSKAPTMEKVEAVKFLQKFATAAIKNAEEARAAYRQGAMTLHPDRGGDPEEFKKLQQAKEILEL